jgi:hypothetical protein
MKSNIFLLTLLVAVSDAQLVSNDGNLRRRLDEKRYPSLWAQDPVPQQTTIGPSDTSQETRGLSVSSPQGQQQLQQQQLQQESNSIVPNAFQKSYASLWSSEPKNDMMVKTGSTASSSQGSKYPPLWSITDSQKSQSTGIVAAPESAQNKNLRAPQVETPQISVPAVTPQQPNRRKFISYQSSKWETYWFDNVEHIHDDRQMCKVLLEDQMRFVRDYLELLCTSKLMAPHQKWCVIDDGYAPLWYNMANKEKLELTFERPVPLVVAIPPPETVIPGPQHEHVLSKFTFKDEATGETYHEYVEPMIGHLRFPLQKCLHPNPVTPQYKNHYMSFRGWILPPPPAVRGDKALLFDAASTSWESNRGGFDLRFIANTWRRHGVDLDEIYVFNEETTSDDFYQDVPEKMVSKTTFQQCSLAGRPEERSEDTPFLPQFINQRATVNDYVILKVDLGEVTGRYNHLAYLDSLTENRVDELIWEHKSEIMFLSDKLVDTDLTLRQSYELVLMMRRRGIRAHAWM